MRKGSSARSARPPVEGLAAFLGVVAHPARLLILQSLLAGVRCVKDLNDIIPVSQPNLSQHVAALRRAGLVECQSRGSLRCYYVLRPDLAKRLLALRPESHPIRRRGRRSVLAELDGATRGRKKRPARKR